MMKQEHKQEKQKEEEKEMTGASQHHQGLPSSHFNFQQGALWHAYLS